MAQPGLDDNSLLTMGGPGSAPNLEDESVSGFTDQLTIDDPSLTGSAGSLQFHFLLTGTENFLATAPAESSMTVSADFIDSGGTDVFEFSKNSSGAVTGSDFLGVPETVTVPFVFGTPFSFSLDVDIQGFLDLSGSGVASTSGTFSTTAGTSNVMALVGDDPFAVSDYSAHSASGADYFTAVPEPAAFPLAALAFATLTLPRIRRRPPKCLQHLEP